MRLDLLWRRYFDTKRYLPLTVIGVQRSPSAACLRAQKLKAVGSSSSAKPYRLARRIEINAVQV